MKQVTTAQSGEPANAEPRASQPDNKRILALDAYRAFIMVLLVGSTCFDGVKVPKRALYEAIAYQFNHRPLRLSNF